jgi:hypothetical protein
MSAIIIQMPPNTKRSAEAAAWDALMEARNKLHDEISGPLPMLRVETMRAYVNAHDNYMREFGKSGGAA